MAPRQGFDKFIGLLRKLPQKASAKAVPAQEKDSEDAVRIYHPPGQAEDTPPARDELLNDRASLPFASYVEEILEEYRSDSSPTRYAMAVELDEPGEEPFGPPAGEPDDPFSANEEPSAPNLLHALLNDAEDPTLPTDAGPEEPAAPEWNWMDILREYRAERHASPAAGTGTAPSENELPPMTNRDDLPAEEPVLEQPHISAAPTSEDAEELFRLPDETPVSAEEDDSALPAGIQRLTERRAAPSDTPHTEHLSVEDILAEFHGYVPEAEDTAPKTAAGDTVPAGESARRKGRRASLEAEARSLFSGFAARRTVSPAVSAPETAEQAAPTAKEDPAPIVEADDIPEADEAPVPVSAAAATPSGGLTEQDFALPFDVNAAEEAPASEASVPEPAPEDTKPSPAEEVKEGHPADGPTKKVRLLPFGKKRKPRASAPAEGGTAREKVAGLTDEDASPAAYAVEDDYEAEEEPLDAFPSFGQYLTGLFTGLWVRMRGVAPPANSETMDMEEEDLGEEVKPAAASRYYGAFVPSLRLRFRISLVLWLVLLYISLGFPVSGMLRAVDVAAGMCLGLQLGIMLLSLDVVTGCAINLVRGRFGADSLAVFSCILTSFDALAVLLKGFGTLHVPLCLISSLSLIGVLYASYLSARGLRKSLRVPAIGKRAYSVTAEDELTDRPVTLLKSDRPVSGFVRRSEEAAPDETAYNRAAPLLLVLSLVMSLVIVLVKKSASDFLFVFSAVLAPAVPVTALLSYAMPFFIGSQRIFTSGAAIAGWSGLCDIGNSHNLIVTDRDLFPENCVDIETIRIFADVPSERIIAYAGTMISASGSGLSPCFTDLMERNGCTMRQVENFEFLPGGGLKGTIDGQTVLCGGTELMRLMNVRIPYRLVEKTSVLLAIDGVLYGIFNIKYEPSPTVKKALVGLIRSNRHPVFAIRDFNVNPEMLHETFDVATDGYDFPPYVERFAISDAKPSENRKIAAVLCREGLGPLVHMADTGRNMFLAVRLNLMISLLASVVGVFAVFFLLVTKGTVSLGALLLFALIWIVPVALISLVLRF